MSCSAQLGHSWFDVRITYDKTRQVFDLAATITPELLPAIPNERDRPKERSHDNGVAGRD
jgi:hypothetical protein